MGSRSLPPTAANLTDNEVEVLVAALCPAKGLYWSPSGDRFEVASGNVTRAGRAMRNAGYIRQVPWSSVWLPKVRGFQDTPGRIYELTPTGHDVIRKALGDDTYHQFKALNPITDGPHANTPRSAE